MATPASLKERRSKSRAIKDLLSGARTTMSDALFDRWTWTEEELRVIEPFLSPASRAKVPGTRPPAARKDAYTKAHAFAAIATNTENDTTERVYKSRLNALLRLFEAPNEELSAVFETRTDAAIIAKIRARYKDPTTYVQLVLWLATHDARFAELLTAERLRAYQDAYAEERNLGVERAIDAQKRRAVSDHVAIYRACHAVADRLAVERPGSFEHLIAELYTYALYDAQGVIHMNPRNYFVAVVLVTRDEDMDTERNFLNTATGRMLLNKYKTSGIYRAYDVVLPERTMRVVRASLERTGPRRYLLTKENGEPYQAPSMSHKVKQIMGYKIDDIRHAIETFEIHCRGTSRSHMALVSRHSVATQDLVYVPR